MPRPRAPTLEEIQVVINTEVERLVTIKTSELKLQVSKLEKEIKDLKSEYIQLAGSVDSLNNLQQSTEVSLEQLEGTVESISSDDIEKLSELQQRTYSKLCTVEDDNQSAQDNMKVKVDQLEQDSKEKNLRLVGIQEEENENLKSKVVEVLNNKMNLKHITTRNIDDAYRMGKQKSTGPRDIILKFLERSTKNEVYRSRLKMAREDNPIYINEDITTRRSKLFYDARKMKKSGKLHNTWTQNGNIMIKIFESSTPQPVTSYSDLRAKVREHSDNAKNSQSNSDFEESDEDLSSLET